MSTTIEELCKTTNLVVTLQYQSHSNEWVACINGGILIQGDTGKVTHTNSGVSGSTVEQCLFNLVKKIRGKRVDLITNVLQIPTDLVFKRTEVNLYGRRTSIVAEVGFKSNDEPDDDAYPINIGNYFCFKNNHEVNGNSLDPHCLNMWAENLEKAKEWFIKDGLIMGYLFKEVTVDGLDVSWFIVTDARIPKEWLTKDFYYGNYTRPKHIDLESEMNYINVRYNTLPRIRG